MFMCVYILILLLCSNKVNVHKLSHWKSVIGNWWLKIFKSYSKNGDLSTLFQLRVLYFIHRLWGNLRWIWKGSDKLSDTISDVVFYCCKSIKIHPQCISENKKGLMHGHQIKTIQPHSKEGGWRNAHPKLVKIYGL